MKIFLLDRLRQITNEWEKVFSDEPNVEIVTGDFKTFMERNRIQCVVSPANSFGLMDGGYDLAITQWFGQKLMEKVQNHIINCWYGEQPIGISFIIETNIPGIMLIHTPTMRIPSTIKDPMVIYQSMRTTLITALENNIESIVIPAFGGATGGVRPDIIANMMYEAFLQVMDPPKTISWNNVRKLRFEEYD